MRDGMRPQMDAARVAQWLDTAVVGNQAKSVEFDEPIYSGMTSIALIDG